MAKMTKRQLKMQETKQKLELVRQASLSLVIEVQRPQYEYDSFRKNIHCGYIGLKKMKDVKFLPGDSYDMKALKRVCVAGETLGTLYERILRLRHPITQYNLEGRVVMQFKKKDKKDESYFLRALAVEKVIFRLCPSIITGKKSGRNLLSREQKDQIEEISVDVAFVEVVRRAVLRTIKAKKYCHPKDEYETSNGEVFDSLSAAKKHHDRYLRPAAEKVFFQCPRRNKCRQATQFIGRRTSLTRNQALREDRDYSDGYYTEVLTSFIGHGEGFCDFKVNVI